MRCENLKFYLICAPDTRAVEESVNQIIKDHPKAKIERTELITAPYTRKVPHSQCPKCGPKCMNTVDYVPGGAHFVLAIWISEEPK